MIEVERVAKRFGATLALADVDLLVAEGEGCQNSDSSFQKVWQRC
jgi:ABC-type branched-subunit amino acid transport system ATPase component